MLFRQLFERESSTYTYLMACPDSGQAVLIDPVVETLERDLGVLAKLALRLAYTLDTHIHADHVSSSCRLRQRTGCMIALPAMERLPCADVGVGEERPLQVGGLTFKPIFTPGHTDTHHCYLLEHGGTQRLFSGDALLIDGCGRTDFQNGNTEALYLSVREKLFMLPDDTLVYPAHDYQGRWVSSIGQERMRNPRLGGDKTLAEFVSIMHALKLDYPTFIDFALPGNRECGVCPTETPENLQQYCGQIGDSLQG